MTDEELIARLREIQGQAGLFASAAADRIEQLVATNEALVKQVRESALQELASLGQAQEAYEAQKAAEAERDALRAERDELAAEVKQADTMLVAEANASLERLARAEAAEAKVEKLRGALERVLRHVDADGVGTVLIVDLLHARAALTTEEGHDRQA